MAKKTDSTTENNGRNEKGQFVNGNTLSKVKRKHTETRRELFEKIYDEVVTPTELKAILLKQVEKAKKGDTKAAELVLERGYGKIKQTLDFFEENPSFVFILGKAGRV